MSSSPKWTPSLLTKNGWSLERASAVARKLEPEASEDHFLRASVSNPSRKVADKNKLKQLFSKRNIPLDYSEFAEQRSTFITEEDVTGV
jgi:hypothetical protein